MFLANRMALINAVAILLFLPIDANAPIGILSPDREKSHFSHFLNHASSSEEIFFSLFLFYFFKLLNPRQKNFQPRLSSLGL